MVVSLNRTRHPLERTNCARCHCYDDEWWWGLKSDGRAEGLDDPISRWKKRWRRWNEMAVNLKPNRMSRKASHGGEREERVIWIHRRMEGLVLR